jgi:hypothetical protein
LHFADEAARKKVTCDLCRKNPSNAKVRRCEEPNFDVIPRGFRLDDFSLSYQFCPGKAFWYEDMIELFQKCRVALETGIMPREGSFEDQDVLFCEVFFSFVQRWRERFYAKVWSDVQTFTKKILESVFSKKGKK